MGEMANLQGVFELYLHQRLPEVICTQSGSGDHGQSAKSQLSSRGLVPGFQSGCHTDSATPKKIATSSFLEPDLSALLNPTDAIAALTDEQFAECQRVAEQLKLTAQAFEQQLANSNQDESSRSEPDSARDLASQESDVIRRISESEIQQPSYLANLLRVCLNRRTLTVALDHISTHMDGWSRIALSFDLAVFLLVAIPDSIGLIKEVCYDYVTRNYLQWINSEGGWQSFLRR